MRLIDADGKRTFVVSETPRAANLLKLSDNFLIASVVERLDEAMALVFKSGMRQYLNILTRRCSSQTYGGLIAD